MALIGKTYTPSSICKNAYILTKTLTTTPIPYFSLTQPLDGKQKWKPMKKIFDHCIHFLLKTLVAEALDAASVVCLAIVFGLVAGFFLGSAAASALTMFSCLMRFFAP